MLLITSSPLSVYALDQVAGGIAHGLAVYETVMKECEEEASIPAEIARKVCSDGLFHHIAYGYHYCFFF